MVQVLPANPGFGSQIGGALGRGFSNVAQQLLQNKMDEKKERRRQEGIGEILRRGGTEAHQEDIKTKFLEALPEIERSLGRELVPEDLDNIWSQLNQSQNQPQKPSIPEDHFSKAQQLAMMGEHDLAKVEIEQAKFAEKRNIEREKRNYELAKPAFEEANLISSGLPQKEAALQNMREAISQGNLGFFSPDNLAEMTGIEGFRSPEGAIFKTAGKEFFMSNLGRVGARGLNQWLERQLADMQPKIGRSAEANLAVTEILQADNDVARKQVELTNQLADKYERELGYIPRDLASKVEKQLTPFAVERQKQAKAKIEEIKANFKPNTKAGVLMRAPDGSLRRVSHKDVKEATKAGYMVNK